MTTSVNNLIVNNLNCKLLAIPQQLSNIPYTVYNNMYLNPSPVVTNFLTPTTGQPVLMYNNLPEIYLASEDNCPYCAAIRWSILIALSRFGVWNNIQPVYSSSTDVYPNTPSMSVACISYVSPYISFVEVTSSDVNGKHLQIPTQQETDMFKQFNPGDEGLPFVSIANQYIQIGSSFSPDILAGMSQADVTANLNDPTNPVTQAIVTAANYFVDKILVLTNNMPENIKNFSVLK